MLDVLALGLFGRDALLLVPCGPVCREMVSHSSGRERERVCVMGDLPLVFAGKVHHSWLGGGVVADGGLLEEAVELRAADMGTVSGCTGREREVPGKTCEELVVLGGLDGTVWGQFAAAGRGVTSVRAAWQRVRRLTPA